MSGMQDDAVGKAYDARLMRRLLQYLRPHVFWVAVAFLAIVGGSMAELTQPWLTSVAIDRYIANRDLDGLWLLGRWFLILLVGAFVFEYIQTSVMQTIGQKILHRVRRDVFEHLQRLDVKFYDRNPVGRLMTRVTTDVDALNDLFASGVVTVFGDLLMLFGIMAWMPLVPSTTWVTTRSMAALASMYAVSRVSPLVFTRKSIISRVAIFAASSRSACSPIAMKCVAVSARGQRMSLPLCSTT